MLANDVVEFQAEQAKIGEKWLVRPDVLSNNHNAAKVPLLQHEMGQGRDAGMLGASLVIKLGEVYVESIFPWDLGEELFGTRNLSLVVLFSESGDGVVGDHARFLGELEKPKSAIVMFWLVGP